MSKYSVSNTMLMPTILTVMTRHIASFNEFQTKRGIVPAMKNFITAKGSVTPEAFFVVKIEVRVFRHGITINPMNRYTNRVKPKILATNPASSELVFCI